MARRKQTKRKGNRRVTFTKKDVGIPVYKNGQETLDNPCDLCGGHVIYTDNAILYKESKGLGFCYYCEDCYASVSCNKRKETLKNGDVVFSPLGNLGDKETRQLRIRCHQILDERWKLRQTMKRSTAYRKLAIGMGIPVESCHFALMNKKQLYYAIDVLTLTSWTRNRFD